MTCEKRWIVVALDNDGNELERVKIAASDLERAIEVFSRFADWVQVVDPDGKLRPYTAWPKE